VPLPPALTSSALDGNTLYLTWTNTFTWDPYNITNYSIIIRANSTDNNSSMVLANLTLGPTVRAYTFSATSLCSELTVAIRASSEIGWSLPYVLKTGLPQGMSLIV